MCLLNQPELFFKISLFLKICFLIVVGSNNNYPDVPTSPPAEGTYEEDWEVFDP